MNGTLLLQSLQKIALVLQLLLRNAKILELHSQINCVYF